MNIDQYTALRTGAGCLEPVDRRWIALRGADRADYLQGLVTNDVVALTPGTGCYAAYLTPQGRMIADMLVFAERDRLVLDLHESVKDRLLERFDDLIFAEEVTVHDLGPDLGACDLHGPRAAAVVSAVVGGPSSGLAVGGHRPVEFAGTVGLVARTDDLGVEGYRVVVGRDAIPSLGEALRAAGARPVEPPVAEAVRVESGRPRFPVDLDTDTIPLEAAIEDRAISFDKGCYVGQEVIVRILHRGHGRVARRLVGLRLEGPAAADRSTPRAGASIRAAGGGPEIGRVTSVAISPALEAVIALGYLPRELADAPGTVVEVAVGDRFVTAVVTTLPFVDPASGP